MYIYEFALTREIRREHRVKINIDILQNFLVHDGSNDTKPHLTEEELETSIDGAMKKADYNWDGFISWDEYLYSMGDKTVQQHVNHMPEVWNAIHLQSNQNPSKK